MGQGDRETRVLTILWQACFSVRWWHKPWQPWEAAAIFLIAVLVPHVMLGFFVFEVLWSSVAQTVTLPTRIRLQKARCCACMSFSCLSSLWLSPLLSLICWGLGKLGLAATTQEVGAGLWSRTEIEVLGICLVHRLWKWWKSLIRPEFVGKLQDSAASSAWAFCLLPHCPGWGSNAFPGWAAGNAWLCLERSQEDLESLLVAMKVRIFKHFLCLLCLSKLKWRQEMKLNPIFGCFTRAESRHLCKHLLRFSHLTWGCFLIR